MSIDLDLAHRRAEALFKKQEARQLTPIGASFLILAGLPSDAADMTKHENIAKALKARLAELTGRVAEIDSQIRRPLSADLEEQATDLENQDALKAIGNSENQEIHEIRKALKRISEGTYGICAQCGEEIDPKRLEALPTATRCISCAA